MCPEKCGEDRFDPSAVDQIYGHIKKFGDLAGCTRGIPDFRWISRDESSGPERAIRKHGRNLYDPSRAYLTLEV